MTDLSIPDLQKTYLTLHAVSTHLRERRTAWLEAHPRDPVSDAYEYGINVPGQRAPQDQDIMALDAAALVVGKEITYQRTAHQGRINRGELCCFCEQPPGPDHELVGYDATGGSQRKFAPRCRPV